MSLATRFSAFFLAALALVLAGFSLALYGLASRHLYQELDVRLEAALDTLEAAIDVEPGGLEWEPLDRRILLGMEPGVQDVRWAIVTLEGTPIDRSANNPPAHFERWRPDVWPSHPPDASAWGRTPEYRMAGRRLLLADLLKLGRGHPEDDGPENDIEYPAMILVAGLSPEPVAANLRQLAWALAGISAGLWILCLALGYWLGRRAMAPVVRMAGDVRALSTAEPDGTLTRPGTGDELDELAVAFNDLVVRFHAALEQQRRFAGDASHQLRTPLAGLLALVDVLARRERSVDEYMRGLGQVHDEAMRMRQIVDSLMFLARSEADALPLELEPVDLGQWLPAQQERWQSHPRFGDLHYEVEGGQLEIVTHPALLAQLLDNLIDNALKYSEPGTPVTARVTRRADSAELSVCDQGVGISVLDRPYLFEPFYRSADTRRHHRRGVGLGLAVVQRIVTSLGATIEVESAPGRGTQFRVSFAAAPLPAPTLARSAS